MSSVHHSNPRFLCRSTATRRCAEALALSSHVRRLGARLALLLVAAGAAGCSSGYDGPELPDVEPFPGSAPSLDRLGEEVLAALSAGDSETLERFRLTEHEHNETVWPELPAAAAEVNFPADYAWENIQNRNHRGRERIEPLYRGRDHRFERVECRGETEVFETFAVRTDCWVVFRATFGRQWYEAQIFKDALIRGGGWKIFRYYDEEPRGYRAAATE